MNAMNAMDSYRYLVEDKPVNTMTISEIEEALSCLNRSTSGYGPADFPRLQSRYVALMREQQAREA